MHDRDDTSPRADDASRRRFLGAAGGLAASPLLAPSTVAASGDTGSGPTRSARGPSAAGARPNILFVFTDQQRYIDRWPERYALPGQERLRRDGVTFEQHYCPAVMCTSSRAVMMTGLQTTDNRMFENADMAYVQALSPQTPTIGHMLRKAGYYTAYKGKWHLNAEFDRDQPDRLFTKEMEAYGFSDYVWPGDVIAHTRGGHAFDHMIAGSAVSWLRRHGRGLADERRPWALFASFVNPHDIMYFDTDIADRRVQENGRLLMHVARAPRHEAYRAQWNAPLPGTLRESLTAPGRPGAHREFDRAWGYTMGSVPIENDRWQRFSDYYLNCIRAVDAQVNTLLGELDALGLARNTIVVFTSDHGEMGGAHGLRGKGPFAYQEAIHLPMHVVHPDVAGGQRCRALTSHIDLVPSLLGMAGVTPTQASEFAGRDLPGRNFGSALGAPRRAGTHSVRDAVLFTYSGLATNDSELIRLVSDAAAQRKDPKAAVKAAGYRPDLKKRGTLRTVFDGRYKLTRYFSPLERHTPKDVAELRRLNDLELFDLRTDPSESVNLAARPGGDDALLWAMSRKLDALIAAEMGRDDGREMPAFEGIDWAIDRIDL